MVTALLERIPTGMYARATERLKDNTVLAGSFDQVREIMEPLTAEHDGPGRCILTGETVPSRSVIAKAY